MGLRPAFDEEELWLCTVGFPFCHRLLRLFVGVELAHFPPGLNPFVGGLRIHVHDFEFRGEAKNVIVIHALIWEPLTPLAIHLSGYDLVFPQRGGHD